MKSKYKYYISSTIFVVLILVSFIAVKLITQKIIKKNRSHYENSVTEEISIEMKLRIQNYIDKIESMKKFIGERKITGIDYNEFYLFSSGLFGNDEFIENISISPDAIHELVYPIEYNNLVGYDLLEDKRKSVVEAVTRAMNNNEIIINGPYPMRQDKTKNIIVIRYPVYYDNGNFYRLINVVLKTTVLFNPYDSGQYRDIKFQIIDNNQALLFGAEFVDPIDTIESIPLEHFGWKIAFGRSKSYSNTISNENRIANVLFFSVFIFSLVGGIIFIMTNGKTKLEKEKRTTELIVANKELAFQNEEKKEKVKKISYLSYHDQLTGLYNRRFFEEEIKRLDNPRNLPLSIIMGDVNGLKLTNDAFGHQAGDKLLKMIGDIILKSIRGNDVGARWGGDEFTILLPTSGDDVAEVLINRIHKKIKEVFFEYGNLSISFGIGTKKEEHEDINEIFTFAEKLMYQNKLVESDSIHGQTINAIMATLFEKSIEVKEHSMRVSELATLIAEKMGLSKTNINDIKTMGMIHDIGKIIIDLNILDKPSKLTDEERKIIQQHPLSGSRMLNTSPEYARLSVGVLHHHERIDGKGYPNGILGNQIPLESKIIAVADSFDAMTAKRPYRLTPLTLEEAINELKKYSGTQFDKKVVDVFVNKVLKSGDLNKIINR